MADTILERRARFICITRAYVLGGSRTPVIEDIKVINERETPPPQYIALTDTVDTQEKGTVRRIICVKAVERQAGMKCICDILFLYSSKRPPQSYTLIGDVNGLQMCVREGTVPALRPPSNLHPDVPSSHQPTEHSNAGTLTKKCDDKDMLDGIPFAINPKYTQANGLSTRDTSNGDGFRVLSIHDIERQFDYNFNLERSLIQL